MGLYLLAISGAVSTFVRLGPWRAENMVNIFLSSFVWAQPRPGSGIRHHVLDLYSQVFGGSSYTVYPTRPVKNLLLFAFVHFAKFKSGTLNVVTQGYPVIAAFLALLFGRKLKLIVHTWKVPGY